MNVETYNRNRTMLCQSLYQKFEVLTLFSAYNYEPAAIVFNQIWFIVALCLERIHAETKSNTVENKY